MLVDIDAKQIKQLEDLFGKEAQKKVRQQLHIAVNATSKKAKRVMAKQVTPEIALPQKTIMSAVELWKKSDAKTLTAALRINSKKRFSLKEYSGTRQVKAGVSYKVSKTKGRQLRAGAFMGPKPGVVANRLAGHAFQRTGSTRKPIERLHGASVYGVWMKGRKKKPAVKLIRLELRKQVARRIQFITAKIEGKI